MYTIRNVVNVMFHAYRLVVLWYGIYFSIHDKYFCLFVIYYIFFIKTPTLDYFLYNVFAIFYKLVFYRDN